MTPSARLHATTGLTVALAASALAPLYQGLGWLLPVLAAVATVVLTGAAARAARVPLLLVPPLQALAAVLLAALLYLPGELGSPSAALLGAELLLLDARVGVQELAPPVPSRPELVLLGVLGVAAVTVVVDLLAVGLRRAALAGLPLLVLLAVPSGLVPGGLGWLPFTLGGAGWLLLLRVEADQRVQRWGATLPSGPGEDASSGRVGRRIGVAALGVAAVVPALVPGLDARLLPGSDGPGADGERTTVTYNPITRLQGQLTRPDPQEVLRYRTDDPEPDYLRLTTLDAFDGAGWRSTSLRGEDVEDLELPATRADQVRPVRLEASLGEFLDSQWLPLPALPREVDVDGRWLWDDESQTVFSTTSNTNRIDGYSAEVSRPVPEREELEGAGVTAVPEPRYAEQVPVDPGVSDLVQRIVAPARTPYERAVALQDHFRSGAYTYDVQTGPAEGDPLAAFVLRNRRGYCEQFASAMGAMMRVAGIPSRVAVGFTPGRTVGGERVVTTDDAHAWPEGWFDGVGWVRFEPTPTGDGRTDVPEYTEEQTTPEQGADGAAPTASAAPAPSASASAGALPDELAGDGGPVPTTVPLAQEPSAWQTARGLLLVALVLALAGAPAAAAALRRRVRWREPSALAAWEQLREDARDLGRPWSDADSPRGAAARLATSASLSPLAADALSRLARAAERARYSRDGDLGELSVDGLRADGALVREALADRATPAQRLRARLAPPSTLGWLAGTAGRGTADALDRVDGLLGRVARLGRRTARG